MGTRLRLRVCTWNVGNAPPPADLSAWLGTGAEDYDIIAVGAQEANFGIEKVQSPASAVSPASENFEPPFAESPPPLRAVSQSGSRFRKFHRVFRAATGTRRDEGAKKRGEDTSEQGMFADGGDQYSEQTTEEKRAQGIPVSTSTFPLRNAEGPTNATNAKKILKIQSDDIPAISFSTFTNKEKRPAPFENLDESLLRRSHRNPTNVEQAACDEVDDPIANSFSKPEDISSDLSGRGDDFDSSDAEEDVKEETAAPHARRRSRNLRASVSYLLRSPEEFCENEDPGNAQNATGEKKFSRVLEKSMPSEYHLIAKQHLMEIKLLIFIHERHKSRVVKTECVTEATGIGNVVGNKGAVAVKLTLDDTTFCFVSCHLAAHEGAKFLQQRNTDVVEIMRNIEKNKAHGLPVMHQFNHIFWMGDLNYRLDLKHLLPAAVTWSHEERCAYVIDLVKQKRYGDLASFDELGREMAAENVFGGFTEGKLSFPPTFKVQRGKTEPEYQLLRVPSYCDRILWHSLPLHQKHVKLREYGCVCDIDSSDHKPVYACFDLVIPRAVRCFPIPAPRDTLKCTIDLLSLQVHGLYEKRVDVDDSSVRYEVLEDGALAVSPCNEPVARSSILSDTNAASSPECKTPQSAHTRRVVTATFHGNGMFVKEKPHRTEVPLRDGRRECIYDELPSIAMRPVRSLTDLTYKYVTIVFARLGSRQGSSCVLPMAKFVQTPGRHRITAELELTKYGTGIAKVRVEAELVVSLETWIDTRNKVVRARFR